MPSTPNLALPYPLDTDPWADMALAVEQLAEALDTQLGAGVGTSGWTSFVPSWTGSTSNPAIGNGSILGRYVKQGKRVEWVIEITMGSTTTYGSGNWQLAMPVAETAKRWTFGAGVARDVSATESYPVMLERTAAGVFTVRTDPTTAGNGLRSVSATVPFTWATGDILCISGVYEAS